ncbi:MFS polyamine transporter [Mycena floridula]|nr:MFS polyamine transporter [Mycena floridula]
MTSKPSSPLDQEIADDEQRIQEYGGNDVHDPPVGHGVLKDIHSEAEDSTTAIATVVEPTNQVTWDGKDDPENPQNWPVRQKWIVTILCSLMTMNVTFASSAPTSATRKIVQAFDISTETSYLITSLFLLGYCIGPLLWGPGSELVGRRPVFIATLSLYSLLHLGQALAKNTQTLLITRFFAGFFAVAPLTISGGTIADVWSAEGRGTASSLFGASVFIGPCLGPLVGGFVADSHLGWQWIFWVMMIFASVSTVIAAIFLRETYAPVLLLHKARRLRKANPITYKDLRSEHEDQDWSAKGIIHRTVYRPFKMLGMEPILVLVTIYLSVVYGILYALFEALPIIFIETRGFTVSQNGLIFVGVGTGTILGAVITIRMASDYPILIKQWKGFPPPEKRLSGAMIGGPCLVIGAFWLGWTGQYKSIPWYVPALATPFMGASICMIFMSFLAYLVDVYLMYSASAFAASTIVRSAVGAAFPLFTVQMYHKLGINWASTLIGLLAMLLAPMPFLFYKYGHIIRGHSEFAPGIDLKIAKEMKEETEKV